MEDFKSIPELPIDGGWGYDLESAVFINKNDPVVDPNSPFDGVGVEYLFVEKRIYEELIIFRDQNHKFSGIEWKRNFQQLEEHNGRKYDVLSFQVTAFSDSDWERLKSDWIINNAYVNDPEGLAKHESERDNSMITYEAVYWFDITTFFGT